MSAEVALPVRDAQKLARILGMLGSAHAGERDAEALAADQLVRERGLTWPALLGIEPAANIWERTDKEMIQVCLDHIRFPNDWSQDFIESVAEPERVIGFQFRDGEVDEAQQLALVGVDAEGHRGREARFTRVQRDEVPVLVDEFLAGQFVRHEAAAESG